MHTIHATHSNTHKSGKLIFPYKLKTVVRFKLFRIHSVHHCGQKENKTKQNRPNTMLFDATATAVNMLSPKEKWLNENNSPGFFASTFYYWCCSSLLCLVFFVLKWPISFVFSPKIHWCKVCIAFVTLVSLQEDLSHAATTETSCKHDSSK